MGSQSRSPGAGRVAEQRQAALAVAAAGTIRRTRIVEYICPSQLDSQIHRRFASASSVWRTCSVPALGGPWLPVVCPSAGARLDAGGQLTNAVATSAADDGAIQALSFSKPSARGISGTKRAVVQMQTGRSDTRHPLRKAASPLGRTRGPLADWGRATLSPSHTLSPAARLGSK